MLDRESDLLVRHIQQLRVAVRRARAQAPFRIDAWIVLPEHTHRIWTLPEGDTGFFSRLRAIEAGSASIRPHGQEGLRACGGG